MRFWIAKVVGWATAPLSVGLALALLGGILLARGRRRAGWILLVGAWVSTWVLATPWAAHRLAEPLERRYPARIVAETPAADVAIVLGGGVAGALPPTRPSLDLLAAADRVWYAAMLQRAGRVRWVVVSGGNVPWKSRTAPEGVAMREMLVALGVPDSVIRADTVSRNTRENAIESLAITRALGARRALLITSAMHMPRALRTFRDVLADAPLALEPATTDVMALRETLDPVGRWLPDAEALRQSTLAVKEWVGLMATRF